MNPGSEDSTNVDMTELHIDPNVGVDVIPNNTSEPLGRGIQIKTPMALHKYNVVKHITHESPSSTTLSLPRHTSGTPYPLVHFIKCDKFTMS